MEANMQWAYQEYFVEDKGGRDVLVTSGDSKVLASAVLKLARHVHRTGLRGVSDQQVELVLELIGFAQSACESPTLISSSATNHPRSSQNPEKYVDWLVLLARDVASPWGAFSFLHPSKYLPFLQELAGDLLSHWEISPLCRLE